MRRSWSIFALALLCAAPAAAQEGDFFEQKDTYFKTETVEGVSKHAEAPGETPATVTIISAEEIERYGFRTLADVLNFATLGNFAHNDRRYDFAGGRGLFFFEDFNTRVLVMLNGHPLNEPWNNFGGVGREMLVPLDLVERVEVVYGPSSLLYGGYSLYGILNVVTRTGGSLPGGRVRLTGGSFGTGEAVASWGRSGSSGSLDDTGGVQEWSVLAAAGYYRSQGEDLDLPRQEVGYAAGPEGETVYGGPQEDTDFERAPFAFLYGRRGGLSLLARAGLRRHGAPLAPYASTYGSTDEFVRDVKTLVELRWDRNLGRGLDLSLRGFHDDYSYKEQDPYAAEGRSFVLNTDDRDTGGEARLTWRKGQHYVTFGGELRRRSLTQRSFNVLPNGTRDEATLIEEPIDGHLAVVYLQEEWRPRPQLTLVAGGNYADTEPGGSKAQPRLAAIWKPRDGLAVKALFGQGFRPPSIFEALYGDFTIQIANPGLTSEEITAGELSVLWNPVPKLALQGYTFKSTLAGLIQGVTIEDPVDVEGGQLAGFGAPEDAVGLVQYQSTGDVRSWGLGAAARYRSGGWRAYLNVARSQAELEPRRGGGERALAGSSHWLGSAGASYEHGDWTSSATARYVGPQPLHPSRDGGEAGDFVELNVRALRRALIVYPVTFYLDVRNVFDTEGTLAASPVYTPARVPIEGRRASLGVEVRF